MVNLVPRFARAAKPKYNKLGSLNNRCLLFHSSRGWNPSIEALAGLFPSIGCEKEFVPCFSCNFWWTAKLAISGVFLACNSITLISACLFTWCSSRVCVFRSKFTLLQEYQSCWSIDPFYFRMTSCSLIVSVMTLYPEKVTL